MRKPWTIPWSAEELQLLESYQGDPRHHQLTCNGGLPPHEHVHDHHVTLVPQPDGLRCPECGRLQDWLPFR